jgi:hypothetical protein
MEAHPGATRQWPILGCHREHGTVQRRSIQQEKRHRFPDQRAWTQWIPRRDGAQVQDQQKAAYHDLFLHHD